MTNVVPLRPELPRTLSRERAKSIVHEVLCDSANLIWKDHALQRMEERDVTTMQVLQVLRRGEVTADPVFGNERNWEIRMEAEAAGSWLRIGAAIDVNAMGFVVVVITVVVL